MCTKIGDKLITFAGMSSLALNSKLFNFIPQSFSEGSFSNKSKNQIKLTEAVVQKCSAKKCVRKTHWKTSVPESLF